MGEDAKGSIWESLPPPRVAMGGKVAAFPSSRETGSGETVDDKEVSPGKKGVGGKN